jgi:glutaredoxin
MNFHFLSPRLHCLTYDHFFLSFFFSPSHLTQLYYTELGTLKTQKDSTQAKQLLEVKNKTIPFTLELIRLDVETERRAEMEAISGKKTLPQIFIDSNFIGVWPSVFFLSLLVSHSCFSIIEEFLSPICSHHPVFPSPRSWHIVGAMLGFRGDSGAKRSWRSRLQAQGIGLD